MEYARDEIFNIRYSEEFNTLEIRERKWTSRLYNKIKRHKLVTTTIIAFAMFSTVNFIMIYNFMRILQSV